MILMASKVDLHREIKEAFSRKEKAESLLAKLENLDTSIDEEQKTKLKTEYEDSLSKANEDIFKFKGLISEQITILQDKQEEVQKKSNNLEARFKVGEIDAESYRKQGRNVTQEITKISNEISKYNALLKAQSADEVQSTATNTLTDSKSLDLSDLSSGFKDLPSGFNILKDIQVSDFTTFHHFSEFEFTVLNKVAVIATGLMILSLFLPWVSASAFGVTESTGATLRYFVLGLVAIPAILLKNSKASGIVFTLVGGVTSLLDIYEFINFQRYSDTLNMYSELNMFNASFNVGFYLNLITGLVLVCIGILKLKEEA